MCRGGNALGGGESKQLPVLHQICQLCSFIYFFHPLIMVVLLMGKNPSLDRECPAEAVELTEMHRWSDLAQRSFRCS